MFLIIISTVLLYIAKIIEPGSKTTLIIFSLIVLTGTIFKALSSIKHFKLITLVIAVICALAQLTLLTTLF